MDIVANLIYNDTIWWNHVKVRAFFIPTVAIDIFKIIICSREYKNQWLWKQEKIVISTLKLPIGSLEKNKRNHGKISEVQ